LGVLSIAWVLLAQRVPILLLSCGSQGPRLEEELDKAQLNYYEAVKKRLLRMFGPELIRINELINTARSAVSKTARSTVFFVRHQPQKVARQRVNVRGFLAIFLVAHLSPKRVVLLHKNSLASYQRCSHSVEPRALTCPFKQSILSAWSYPNL